MKTSIQQVTNSDASRLIFETQCAKLTNEQREIFQACFAVSTNLWIGCVKDEIVCVWGLAPPTLLSQTAYLWLFTTEALVGYEFRLIRHSQRMIEEMLKLYPTIVGHTNPNHPRSVVWLKWLGARFGEPAGDMMPFEIRKSNGSR